MQTLVDLLWSQLRMLVKGVCEDINLAELEEEEMNVPLDQGE